MVVPCADMIELHNFWLHRPFHFIPRILDMVEIRASPWGGEDSLSLSWNPSETISPSSPTSPFCWISLHWRPNRCLLSKKNGPPPTWRHLWNPAVCHVPFEPLPSSRHNEKHSLHHHATTTSCYLFFPPVCSPGNFHPLGSIWSQPTIFFSNCCSWWSHGHWRFVLVLPRY